MFWTCPNTFHLHYHHLSQVHHYFLSWYSLTRLLISTIDPSSKFTIQLSRVIVQTFKWAHICPVFWQYTITLRKKCVESDQCVEELLRWHQGCRYCFALQDGTWDFSWDAVGGKGFILRWRGNHVAFLELWRDSRISTGNTVFLMCWPREVLSSIRHLYMSIWEGWRQLASTLHIWSRRGKMSFKNLVLHPHCLNTRAWLAIHDSSNFACMDIVLSSNILAKVGAQQ